MVMCLTVILLSGLVQQRGCIRLIEPVAHVARSRMTDPSGVVRMLRLNQVELFVQVAGAQAEHFSLASGGRYGTPHMHDSQPMNTKPVLDLVRSVNTGDTNIQEEIIVLKGCFHFVQFMEKLKRINFLNHSMR
jgi:hypothetical protein